jgi:hypothetical protein
MTVPFHKDVAPLPTRLLLLADDTATRSAPNVPDGRRPGGRRCGKPCASRELGLTELRTSAAAIRRRRDDHRAHARGERAFAPCGFRGPTPPGFPRFSGNRAPTERRFSATVYPTEHRSPRRASNWPPHARWPAIGNEAPRSSMTLERPGTERTALSRVVGPSSDADAAVIREGMVEKWVNNF